MLYFNDKVRLYIMRGNLKKLQEIIMTVSDEIAESVRDGYLEKINTIPRPMRLKAKDPELLDYDKIKYMPLQEFRELFKRIKV